MKDPRYVSTKQVAEMLKVTERSVRRMIASGKLQCEKNAQSKAVRFLKADVETYISTRVAVAEAKEFIGSDSLSLNAINAPYAGPKKDPDDSWSIVQDGPATSRRVEGPQPPKEPEMTPEEQNAAFIAEQAHAAVIWVGDQGFQGIDEHGRTAEVRALQYRESLKQNKRFRQLRGV